MRGKTLGELLVEEALVAEVDLQAVVRRARRDAVPLVVALVEGGEVNERQLLDALERRLKLTRVDLASVFVEMDAVREVTYTLASAHCLLPLALERQGGRRVLRVAMADPLDGEAIEEIEASTGCRVETVISPASELGPAIEKAYRGIVTKLIHRAGSTEGEVSASGAGDEGVTQPHRRIEDVAPLEARLRALVLVLAEKGLVTDEEYRDAIRRLLGTDGEA